MCISYNSTYSENGTEYIDVNLRGEEKQIKR